MASHVITHQRADILAGRVQTGPTHRLAELLVRFDAWLERRRRYRATVTELSALSDELLADVGIARHEIHSVAERLTQRPAYSW